MAVRYLKTGKPQEERSEDDARVRAVVEAALAEIDARGDAAVREPVSYTHLTLPTICSV